MTRYSSALSIISVAPNTLVGRETDVVTLRNDESSWEGIETPTSQLSAAAAVSDDIYAIARMVASEVGWAPAPAYQLAVAECVVAEAQKWSSGGSAYNMLVNRTRASYAWTKGKYGRQKGRWASTARDPNARCIAAARGALGGSDLTGPTSKGARFFDGKVMDGGVQGGDKLRLDALGLVAEWGLEGWQWIGPLPGVDSYKLAVMKKVTIANNAAMVEVIMRGRRGESSVGASDGPDSMHQAAAKVPWWAIVAGGIVLL